MMVTAYFVGIVLNVCYVNLPAKLGRRKSVIAGSIVACISQTLIIFVPNFFVRTASFFVLGLSQIKLSQSYLWISDMVPMRNKSFAFTCMNIFDASPMLVSCAWYLFISRDWFPLNFGMLVITWIAAILAFFVPESPKWLLVKGRKIEAVTGLNRLASCNKSAFKLDANKMFEEEIKEEKNKLQYS